MSDTFDVDQPDTIAFDGDLLDSDDVTCNGYMDGWISLEIDTVVGDLDEDGWGTPPYNYILFANAVPIDTITSSSDSVRFTGLAGNDYKAILKDDNGCQTDTAYFEIDEAIAPLEIDASVVVPISCNDEDDGQIRIHYDGDDLDDGGYIVTVYESDDDSLTSAPSDFTVSDSSIINNLAGDTYYIIARDEDGCADTLTGLTVVNPDTIVVNDVFVTNNICAGQCLASITYDVTGGRPSFAGLYCVYVVDTSVVSKLGPSCETTMDLS